MIEVQVDKNVLRVATHEEIITSGAVNLYTVHFTFDTNWVGLTKKIVFKAGNQIVQTLLNENNQCTIPWEVLAAANEGKLLFVGVRGEKSTPQPLVLPTLWDMLGVIREGTVSAQTVAGAVGETQTNSSTLFTFFSVNSAGHLLIQNVEILGNASWQFNRNGHLEVSI